MYAICKVNDLLFGLCHVFSRLFACLMTLDHYRPVDEIISYLEEVNFLRFSIVGLAHDVIASISPLLKCTSTSSSMPDDS